MQSGTTSARSYFSAEMLEAAPQTRPQSLGEIGGAPAPQEASLSFRDVLDAINPLNHIPIISDLFASATDHTPSTGAKLAGGTLFGGPIGFVASLANIIFEEATGSTPVKAVLAALSGEHAAEIAVASSAAPTTQPVESNAENPAAPFALASAEVTPSTRARGPREEAILSLYGASTPSAHASYRSAQLRPYLTDVTVSRVL